MLYLNRLIGVKHSWVNISYSGSAWLYYLVNYFLFLHNSFVSTWPMRRCTTISMKCFFYRSKQNVYKKELPWKQLILLVTRLEFWIFFSRYSYNVISDFMEYMHLNMLETNNFLSKGFTFEISFYVRFCYVFIVFQSQQKNTSYLFWRGIWRITNSLKGQHILNHML